MCRRNWFTNRPRVWQTWIRSTDQNTLKANRPRAAAQKKLVCDPLIVSRGKSMASTEKKTKNVRESIAAISHQVKNILQGINGGAHLVESGIVKRDIELTSKGWEIVKRNQNQISQLVMNLMLLSKTYETNREFSDLGTVINQSFLAFAASFDLEQVDVSLDLPATSQTIKVDSQAIQLLFQNLFSHAIRAIRSFDQKFCRINATVHPLETEVEIVYGGLAPAANSLVVDPVPTDQSDEHFHQIELEVASKIITAHGGSLGQFAETESRQRLTVSIPHRDS